MSKESQICVDRYERLELIGTGSFGDVYRGWDREAGVEVAIKVIDLENVEDDLNDIHREVAILSQSRSDNITEYFASVLEPGTTELLIVMELMACSVGDLLSDEGSPLDERSIAFVLRETLKALLYLHESNRIHRDVKSANVLLSAHGEVKISDFGVSGQLSKTVAFKRRTFVGSPFWMAPEVIKANSGGDGYSDTADIWSLGVTAYELATGKPPHADLHPMRALFLIPAEDPPRLEGPFSPELKSFVAQCLQKEPSLRPSASALLRHAFLDGPHDSGRLAELVYIHSEKKRKAHASSQPMKPSSAAPASSKWDFDTQRQAPPGATSNMQRGSIRSHQINSFTIPDSTWGTTFAMRPLQSAVPNATQKAPIQATARQEGIQMLRKIPEPVPLAESQKPVSPKPSQQAAPAAVSSCNWAFQNAAGNDTLCSMLEQASLRQSGYEEPAEANGLLQEANRLRNTEIAPVKQAKTLSRFGQKNEEAGNPQELCQNQLLLQAHSPEQAPDYLVCKDNAGPLGSFLLSRWQYSVTRKQQRA